MDIICLQETWARNDSIGYLNFSNYYLASFYCRQFAKGGGVGIWLKNRVKSSKIDVSRFCCEKSIELCCVKIHVNKQNIVILNCYRSPNGDMTMFLNNLESVLHFLYKPCYVLYLCGDINIDFYFGNSKKDNHFYNFERIIRTYGLFPVVKWPTRIHEPNTFRTIDNIFTNSCDNKSLNHVVLDNTFSDHRSILCECNFNHEKNKTIYFSYENRNFNEKSITDFGNELSVINWKDLYMINDINDAFDVFIKRFLEIFDRHFPVRKRVKKRLDDKKWVNNAVRESSSQLKDMFYMYKSFPELKKSYDVAKKVHNEFVKNTKKNYFQRRIFNADNPGKMAWKLISELSGKNNCQEKTISLELDGEKIEKPKDVCEIFNDFFIEAPANIVQNIKQNNNSYLDPSTFVRKSIHTFFLQPISSDDLETIINSKLKKKGQPVTMKFQFIYSRR